MSNNTKSVYFPLSRNTFYKSQFSPPTVINKTEKGYKIYIEVPGLDLDTVSVDVQDNTLCVIGVKEHPSGSSANYYRNEVLSGPFSRAFTLPNDADKSTISAVYKKGYLCVTVNILEDKLPKPIKVINED